MSSGCGDVLSLADLQTAKKHQIFEAEVITGKSGGVATGADIDYATNAVTGQTQKTLPAVLRDAGFSPVSWDFSTGGTLTVNDRDKVVYDPVSKTWYSYAGTLPVTVPAGFNPVGNADWKPQTDPDLRNDLASLSGASLLGGGLYSDIRTYSGDNSVILCKGAFAINDGGAGVFRLDTSGSVAVDDGGYRLIDANGRMWVRDVGDCVLFNWWVPDITGATDSLAKLTAAASVAALLRKPLILPAGVIGITDEFVPPNGLDMRGYGNSLRAGNSFATTIKWIGGVAVKKAVIRCSRSPIGITPTEDVSAVRITNILADCDNKATNGFYFRYFTNESHCDNITAINARVVGISVYQSWFCSFGTIVAHDNYGRGVVIGYPTQGETDDLAVNSINFLRIRTHTNGRNGDFEPSPGSATRYSGAGLITRSSGCTYSNIQSERNFGFGWIETSPRSSNEFGSYYTEFNGVSDGSNGYGFLSPDDIGGYKSTYINSVTLYSREQFINEAETPVCIGNFTKAVDAFNSVFSGVGGFRIMGGSSIAATEYQSESNYSTALKSIPYTMLREDFNLGAVGSLSAGVILPTGVTRVKLLIQYRQSTPSSTFTISAGGVALAFYSEGAHSSGDVVEKNLTLPSNSTYLSLSSTSLSGTYPATAVLLIGRFNNGDVSKLFTY